MSCGCCRTILCRCTAQCFFEGLRMSVQHAAVFARYRHISEVLPVSGSQKTAATVVTATWGNHFFAANPHTGRSLAGRAGAKICSFCAKPLPADFGG